MREVCQVNVNRASDGVADMEEHPIRARRIRGGASTLYRGVWGFRAMTVLGEVARFGSLTMGYAEMH